MPSLPNKLQSGDLWKQSSINAINQIIDYLKSQKIVGDNSTVSISQGVNGITISAKPQTSAKPNGKGGGETTVIMGQGTAVPARMYDNIVNPWSFPYAIQIFPSGYGDTSTSVKAYALPTTVAFSPPPPQDEPIIAFSTYICEVGGTMEQEGRT